MEVYLESDQIRVECEGLKLLKLKTEISKRLAGNMKAEKSAIIFPQSALPLVRDLLDVDESSSDIACLLRTYDNHSEARQEALRNIESGSIENIPEFWLQTLDPAQAYAVSAMITPGLLGLCLFDEQGSGKTVMTIAAFDILKSDGIVDAMIVVCPKTMMSEWPKDVERFLPGKYRISTAEGTREDKFQTALRDFDILVTNYEGVEHMKVAIAATSSQKRYLLAIDESYYVKNTESLRSEAARKMRAACKQCFVLCGTPAPNSPYDLVNQFDLADMGYTFTGFQKTDDLDRDKEKISQLIETRGTFIRRLKVEVLHDIPNKNFHVIRIPLTGRQAVLYDRARASLELELRSLDNNSFKRGLVSYFQRRAALLQICANPSAVDPAITDIPVKYEYLDKLLADLIGQGRKVIIWSFYKDSLDQMMVRYASYKPVRIDGSVDMTTRREAVRLFQDDPHTMLFIGNPAAAGAGVTLHAASDAIYVSFSNQAAHYLQSLDRIHRRGQTAAEVNYYLLVCQGTIEETEVVRLRGKELQQQSLLGDQITWPTSLDDALSELQGHI